MNFALATCLLLLLKVPDLNGIYFNEPNIGEGSSCELDQEGTGICKKITECPSRLKEVKMGIRGSDASKGRCGFSGFMEIVCCPLQEISQKIGIRPADLACKQFENELIQDEVVFHIINGEDALENEFPYVAALGYEKEDDYGQRRIEYACGGTLISQIHILTAAHCVSNVENKRPILVRMGSNDLRVDTSEVQKIQVRDIVIHPDYKRSSVYNDVAIIRLQRPVQLTDKVKPICMQTKPISRTLLANASFIVIGWGTTDFGANASPTLLKTPSMSIIERKDCSTFYTRFQRLSRGVDESMLCAKDPSDIKRSDACQGDSGGPMLMISQKLQAIVGITSFGQACGSAAPAIYMSVYYYVDWIESMIWPEVNRK